MVQGDCMLRTYSTTAFRRLASGLGVVALAWGLGGTAQAATVDAHLSLITANVFGQDPMPTVTFTTESTAFDALASHGTTELYAGLCADPSCSMLSAVVLGKWDYDPLGENLSLYTSSTQVGQVIRAYAYWTVKIHVEATDAGFIEWALPYSVWVDALPTDQVTVRLSTADSVSFPFYTEYDSIELSPTGAQSFDGALTRYISWGAAGDYDYYAELRVYTEVMAVPEPQAIVMVLGGLIVAGGWGARRRRIG